jgi:hypothetical protein
MNALTKSSLIAVGALLPFSAWSNDRATKSGLQREAYDSRPSETRSASPAVRAEQMRDESRTSDRAQDDMDAPRATFTPDHGAGSGIERITKDELERRVTATDLIGTKVLDREGREIGKIKDIGLASVAPQLADTRTTSRNTDASEATSELSQSWTRHDQREARVFVSPDRSLSAGDALVAIPAAQLHREGDALRLDMSREELRSFVSVNTNRVSMNR